MDAHERIDSHSRRQSIKRPWEDEDNTVPENAHTWHSVGLPLPPINATSYYKQPLPQPVESESRFSSRYDSESGGAKRTRYEEHGYNSLSRENLDLNVRLLQRQSSRPLDDPAKSSSEQPSLNAQHLAEGRGRPVGGLEPAGSSRDILTLCQKCRRLTTQHQDPAVVDTAEEELVSLGMNAVDALSNLHAILHRASTGRTSPTEKRKTGLAASRSRDPIGLKDTLKSVLESIYVISDLADNVVQHVQHPDTSIIDRQITQSESDVQDDTLDIMKRRIVSDVDDPVKDSGDAISDTRLHIRRRSGASLSTNNEDSIPINLLNDYNGLYPNADVLSHRATIMNPPPAPGRQLPSPPGRSLPSPTSMNFPSPSAGSYGSSTYPVNLPPPSGLHHNSINTFLPPINQSPDAQRTHSAALQHEVSVQKIALSSLQSEHDKLLAAIPRMQTRAAALEKKHEVSDAEIISLSEEKLRLQSQIADLERDVEELTRSRDGFRQSSVEEGAQYIEIVKKASQLEEIAGQERKVWAKLKAEMEQRIESLAAGSTSMTAVTAPEPVTNSLPEVVDSASTQPSSMERHIVKAELSLLRDPDLTMQEELVHLRRRCAESEDALRAIRDSSQSMESAITALGLAGKSIMEQAVRTLGDAPNTDQA